MRARLLARLASAAAISLATSAGLAADLPSRIPAPAPVFSPVPIFTWTGFYAGVNAGAGWLDNNNNNAIFVPPGTFAAPFAGATGTITFADGDNDIGFVGGGQVGYNFQIGQFVLGAEADIHYADLGNGNGTAFVPAGFPPSFVAARPGSDLEWFGTVRARLGFAFDRALIYATGGFAYGGGGDNDFNGLIGNNDDTRTGWTLGAGVEYAFINTLTLGVEGLWVSLDRGSNGSFIGTVGPTATPVFVPAVDNDSDNDFFVARAKLNFKF